MTTPLPRALCAMRSEQAILTGIQFLRDERDQDPNRGLIPRLRRRVE